MTSARKVIIFDIETAPLPDAEIAQFIPQFDPPSNYKDPEKIQQWLDAKKIGWAGEAALSPLTGRVDAIGIVTSGGKPVAQLVEPGQEAAVIAGFWLLFQSADSYTFFTGFNIKRFDLPFLVRRSWKLGVAVPAGVREGRYWSGQFVDLMELWQLGNNQEYIALDKLAKFMGLPGKTGNGADFHKMEPADKKKYLETDLALTKALAERMLT